MLQQVRHLGTAGTTAVIAVCQSTGTATQLTAAQVPSHPIGSSSSTSPEIPFRGPMVLRVFFPFAIEHPLEAIRDGVDGDVVLSPVELELIQVGAEKVLSIHVEIVERIQGRTAL